MRFSAALVLLFATLSLAKTKGSKSAKSHKAKPAAKAASIPSAKVAPIPAGALVVGAAATYKTVQSAVNAAEPGATIYIHAGIYKEQVYIPATKPNLMIIGESADPSSYVGNLVTIAQGRAQDTQNVTMVGPNGTVLTKLNNDNTGTLRAYGNGLKMYNVNLVNTRGMGSQALALSAFGDQLGFYKCQFVGYQDTIMSQKGQHFIGDSLIVGATDYIFGQYGVLWIENTVLQCLHAQVGYITANGRLDATNPSYYVINNSKITGGNNGTMYLGRPWRDFARVVFQFTEISADINPAGWSVWTKGVMPPPTVSFAEYKNTGPGAVITDRVSFSKQLKAPVAIGTLFPSTSWIDPAFLGKA